MALSIARDHLEDMGQDHYNSIARETGSTQEKVRVACRLIRSLNPRPGARFAVMETAKYLIPDLAVAAVGNGFESISNDTYIPLLRISPYYVRLMTISGDTEVQDYPSASLTNIIGPINKG